MKKIIYGSLVIAVSCLNFSCQKDFLEIKPDKALLVPVTLNDFQELLDNSADIMNFSPNITEIAADDIYITTGGYMSLQPFEQNAYKWDAVIYGLNTYSADWSKSYQQVFYANVALDHLMTMNNQNDSQYNDIRGQALFIRALAFYNLAQIFAAPYDPGDASMKPGIPIRLEADVNKVSVRSTVEQTYGQIVTDLQSALALVPEKPLKLTRPGKAAVYGLLARIYLSMEKYNEAKKYASACLAISNKLIDFNSIHSTATYKMPKSLAGNNDEVIYHSVLLFTPVLTIAATTSIDLDLYHSYADNDLRKELWYKSTNDSIFNFKGNYSGTLEAFSGIASDEIYLIEAECLARSGNIAESLNSLNTLLKNRYKTGTFVPYSMLNSEQALRLILKERRKELVYRNLRWTDLRRLNKDQRFAVELTRVINGRQVTVPPNDKRYVFLIPEDVVALANLEQNPF